MSAFLKFNLIIHVFAGVIGVICSYAVLMGLLKKKPNFAFLKAVSLASVLGYAVSALSGKYYEEIYYEAVVKPVIEAGKYPWAHGALFEAKEAAFVPIPILALLVALAIWFWEKRLEDNEKLKKEIALLSMTAVILGTFVALTGMLVSGAANG